MVAHRGRLVVVEANSGVLDRVPVDGRRIRRIVDINADRGNIVPTAVARDRGRLYLGNLGEFPITPGTQAVYRVRKGHLQTIASGFTAILGIAFDSRHRLYVLETSTEGPYPQAGKGRTSASTGPGSGRSSPTA